MALISVPVCLLSKETYALFPLLTCAIASLGIGQIRYREIFLLSISYFNSSALGTCGFCSVSVESWDGGAKLLMILAMLIGRAAGSTVGGIKLSRFVTIFKAVIWRFRRIALLPHEMMRYKLDGDSL